ncbi:MAG: peptidase C11 [Clostridia bacterium]|nr:peptidase C11 [Clostridia bacterium]
MKKDVQSKGREKNVTSGKGNVYKRGDGLNAKKPVGNQSGYSDRPKGSQSSQSSSSGTPDLSGLFSGSSGSSSQKATGGLDLKKIIIIGIIIIVGYFLLKSCANIDLLGGTDMSQYTDTTNTGSSSNQSASGELDYSVSNDARSKYTNVLGKGQDEFTIMVYMCGSDLESRSGMATADLNEMLHATIADNVNIIVETGGAKTWKNSVVSSSTNERYQLTSEGLKRLDGNLGRKQMTDPATLADFIKYCTKNFEANRYALILWDHGGGSTMGYGHDEFYPNATMTLDEINTALSNGGTKFDFVGFDACLMATYETAVMLNNHADYMIASEETEPGIGWYYTDWITALSENTSMPTIEIGQNIIDDFIDKTYESSPMDKTTLSLVDLAELSGTVPEVFNAFASSTGELINSDEYKIVADARGYSREFGSPSQLDQIDLIHLAQNMGTDDAEKLIDALDGCIKYNRTSSTISNSNGISIYFPYTTLSSMSGMINTYEKIGMDKAYTDCIRGFASLEVGGQAISTGSSNPLGSLLGSFTGSSGSGVGDLLTSFLGSGALTNMLGGSDTSWVDTDAILNNTEYYEENSLKDGALELSKKDGDSVLALSKDDWDLVQTVQLNVFFDDGEGYIDLGMDNVYEFNNDGDLIIGFDGTWLALDGQVVAYYFVDEKYEGDEYAIVGRVPAMLNGDRVDLMLAFTSEVPKGQILGARLVYDDGSVAKGLIELNDGDVLDFLCDYYTYDEKFSDSYYLGDQMVVNGKIQISNVSVGDATCLVTYMLTDIYSNTYWTPAIEYK